MFCLAKNDSPRNPSFWFHWNEERFGRAGDGRENLCFGKKPKLVSRWGDREAKAFSTTMWNLNSPRLHVNRRPSTPSITRTIQPMKSFCGISTWLQTTYNSIHIFNRPRFPVDYSNSERFFFFLNYFQSSKTNFRVSFFTFRISFFVKKKNICIYRFVKILFYDY